MIDVITAKVVEDNNKVYAEYKLGYGIKRMVDIKDRRCSVGDNLIGYLTESNDTIKNGDHTVYGTVKRITDKHFYIENNRSKDIIKMHKSIINGKTKRIFNVIATVKAENVSINDVIRPVTKFVNLHKTNLIFTNDWQDVEVKDVLTKKRHRPVVFVRHLSTLLYLLISNKKLLKIEDETGIDHSNIVHSKKVIINELGINPLLRNNIQSIINDCYEVEPQEETKTNVIQHNFNTCMV